MSDLYVGIDIGGSHIEVGLVENSGKVLLTRQSEVVSLEITATEIVALVKTHALRMIEELNTKGNYRIVAVGIGCPGQTNGDILVAASNFPKFINVPFVRLISDAFGGIPVKLLNDADAAVCAEVWGNPEVYSKYDNIALFTLGTGIGCGLILNGELFQGSHGMVEAGHMIVTNSSQSRPCGCGQKGCVEAYSSAKSTVKRLQEMDLQDKNPSSTVTDGKDVFARYQLNDFNAVKVVEETAEHLAVMSINICRVIDPQVIIFGGGLSKAGVVLLDLIRKYVREKTWTVLPTEVKLNLAVSDQSGVLGSALAAKQKYLKGLVKESHSENQPLTKPAAIPTTASVQKEEVGILNNTTFGSCVILTAGCIYLLSGSRAPDRSSASSYLYGLLLLGQFGIGIALILR